MGMGMELDKKLEENKYELLAATRGFMRIMWNGANRQWASSYACQLERDVWQVIDRIEGKDVNNQ